MQLDLNNAQCIKSISNFGSTTYVDICNGGREIVEWGFINWVLLGFILLLLILLGIFIVALIRDN